MTTGAPPTALHSSHDSPSPALLRTFAAAVLAMSGEDDQRTLLMTALAAMRDLVGASGSSFWGVGDADATCQLAIGLGADTLLGSTLPVERLGGDGAGAALGTVIAAPIVAGSRTVGYLRATRDAAADPTAHDGHSSIAGGAFGPADLEVLALLAGATGAALRLAARMKASDRSDDIKLVQELSREIGSSLDLDRVLQTTVNIAARALAFDVGVLALYENGKCEVRAMAGASTVDAGTDAMQDLSFRAAWAAGTGEALYLSDRDDPGSDQERIFLQFFASELDRADVRSGLYLPLRDEEGIVGILLFESKRAEFAEQRARDVASILANQATVAIRNAKLYSQVPLAEALGAISAKRAAFFAIPRRKRLTAALVGVAVLAALTLVRWPLRVMAESPVLEPTAFTDVRPLVAGMVARVLVREGDEVAAGAVIAELSDIEARAARTSAEAALGAATRTAALAASRGDAAEQRLQSIREQAARAELALRDEQLSRLTIRAPAPGVVLTSRPEELQSARVDAGSHFVVLGRTDTLELTFGVDQQDVERVRPGDEVRIRLEGSPQRTFSGRVSVVGALPLATAATTLLHVAAVDGPGTAARVRYPVRASVPNPSGVLRAGMVVHARVLTGSASVAGRALRKPVRVLRILWWRMSSWL